jgi:hypothetical protein
VQIEVSTVRTKRTTKRNASVENRKRPSPRPTTISPSSSASSSSSSIVTRSSLRGPEAQKPCRNPPRFRHRDVLYSRQHDLKDALGVLLELVVSTGSVASVAALDLQRDLRLPYDQGCRVVFREDEERRFGQEARPLIHVMEVLDRKMMPPSVLFSFLLKTRRKANSPRNLESLLRNMLALAEAQRTHDISAQEGGRRRDSKKQIRDVYAAEWLRRQTEEDDRAKVAGRESVNVLKPSSTRSKGVVMLPPILKEPSPISTSCFNLLPGRRNSILSVQSADW